MVSILSCVIVLGCSVVSALTLNPISPNGVPRALNATIITTPTYASHSNAKVIDLGVEPHCTGPETGVGLTGGNCQDLIVMGIPEAIERIQHDYGDRRVGTFEVNLPQRYISGEYEFSRPKNAAVFTVRQGMGAASWT